MSQRKSSSADGRHWALASVKSQTLASDSATVLRDLALR
jgi:hypothetical protein